MPLPTLSAWLAASGLTAADVVVSQRDSDKEGIIMGEWRWRYIEFAAVEPEKVPLWRFSRGLTRYLREQDAERAKTKELEIGDYSK